jgi:hypothetical protein
MILGTLDNYGIRFHCSAFEKCLLLQVVEIAIDWFKKKTPNSEEPSDKWQRIAIEAWEHFDRNSAERRGYCWIEHMFAVFNQFFF